MRPGFDTLSPLPVLLAARRPPYCRYNISEVCTPKPFLILALIAVRPTRAIDPEPSVGASALPPVRTHGADMPTAAFSPRGR